MKRNINWLKLTGFFAALALLLILTPATAALADSYNDGLATWSYTVNGSFAAITGVTLKAGTSSVGTLVIPEAVPSGSTYVPVNTVGGFSGAAAIGTIPVDKVVIPRHVTTIANDAFKSCTNIKSFDLRCRELETIGPCAFYFISSLTSIDLPETVESIGTYAFFQNGFDQHRYS